MVSYDEHRKRAPKSVKVTIITVSSSRYEKASKGMPVKDESGTKAVQMVKEGGHSIVARKLIPDNIKMIRLEILRSLYDEEADVLIITGGTGLTKSDITVESVKPLFEKEIPGFGEIYRMESYKSIGPPSYLSRALAGTIGGKLIFCLPGSPNAVEVGLGIVIPELGHSVFMAKGG